MQKRKNDTFSNTWIYFKIKDINNYKNDVIDVVNLEVGTRTACCQRCPDWSTETSVGQFRSSDCLTSSVLLAIYAECCGPKDNMEICNGRTQSPDVINNLQIVIKEDMFGILTNYMYTIQAALFVYARTNLFVLTFLLFNSSGLNSLMFGSSLNCKQNLKTANIFH